VGVRNRDAAGVDQLEYEDASSNKIAAVLFDLGTPEIKSEPTNERAQSRISEIEAWNG
jgi:hypothetical protein